MRKIKWGWLLAALLLSACGAEPEQQTESELESDSFYEMYHLKEPVADELRSRVEGIKACFDALKLRDTYPLSGDEDETFSIECRPSPDDPGMISLFAYDKEGNALWILSQSPALDGYEYYASSYGTYNAASQVFAATNVGACFYYETETGRVIGAYTYDERDPEYDELYEQWIAAKNGG